MISTMRYIYLLAVVLFISPTQASVCPPSCMCTTTRDGLHRAVCSDLTGLYKFTLRQRHHNINILDLSHNNITKLNHELDRLTEVVTLDLSTNGIVELNKFLNNAKKLVHLNLANNRIKTLSLSHLPTSVSSLDLTNNLLKNVPSDLRHLTSLEHLELEGNPLDCTCENIKTRDYLLHANVFIDHVICTTPVKVQGKSWLELKTKEICSNKIPENVSMLDIMVGDQPEDAIRIGRETTQLKSMSLVASNDLEDGEVVEGTVFKDDDDLTFMKADKRTLNSHHDVLEGSGDVDVTTVSDIEIRNEQRLEATFQETEQLMPFEEHTTVVPLEEGSGWINIEEGSGTDIPEVDNPEYATTTVPPPLYTGPIVPIFRDHFFSNTNDTTSEYPVPPTLNIYEGNKEEITTTAIHTEQKSTTIAVSAEVSPTVHTPRDTTVSQQIIIQSGVVTGPADEETNKTTPHKAGTYVCIALIVILLVGLIGFAIIKGQIRKRRDRRLLRQQRRDVEKASKEMVDMNKSLLGKPAPVESPVDRKINGKYELVPTHEPTQNKGENGDIPNGMNRDSNGVKESNPRDSNQNKNSSKDNNVHEQEKPIDQTQQETSLNMTPTSPDSIKDTRSLSSEDIFVPMNDEDQPHINGITDSEISQPLINGNPNTDSDFLSPSREYMPVYSPDMSRVRTKLTETPKPKTPVLVTRSRSNAGDIIITPASDANNRKSTT